MSHTTDYKIGTTVGNVVYVEELVLSEVCNPPGGSVVEPFAVYREAASGLEYGDGYPHCTWTFQRLSKAMMTALLAYLGTAQSAAVVINTRKSDYTFGLYTAVMHRPKLNDEMRWELRSWRDVEFRFTMLETTA